MHTASSALWRVMFVAVLFVAAPAGAATYYAGSQGCSDSGDGQTAAAPFCTLKHAVSRLKPGDTLLLLGATFKEQLVVSLVASAASPIVIQADEDATPVIDGQGLSQKDTGLVLVDGAKHVTIRGLLVQNATADCVRVSGGESVSVDRVQASGCQDGGIVVVKTVGAKITSCEITNTGGCATCSNAALSLSAASDFVVSTAFVHVGTRDGIALRDGTRKGKVFTNVVQEMGGAGIALVQASDVEVHENDLHTNQTGIVLSNGTAGVPLASRNLLYRNLIWNHTANGIRVWPQQATGEIRDNKLYNNDLVGNAQAGIQLGDSTLVVRDNILRNNIFMSNTGGSILGAAAAANTISHSLFAPPQAAVGTNAVTGDPLFANASFGNFHLSAGSPAIDQGYDMGLPTVGAPDIGAFEFGFATIPDAGTGDTRPAAPSEPDRGCGCSSGREVKAIAASSALVLLIAFALRRFAGGRRARSRR